METQKQPDKVDRRVMRSKRLIIEAWRELVLEKDHNEISVSDIVKRADIGRATFYSHFEDKNHLRKFLFGQLQAQIEGQIQAILNKSDGPDHYFQQLVPSLAIFRIAQEKRPIFKKNATDPEVGLSMLVPTLVRRAENRLTALNRPDDHPIVPQRLAITFLVNGLIALLTDWLVTDSTHSPEEMDEIYQTLARPTFERLLGPQ